MIAGYETTATTLTFAAYCLATNQECQEKMIMEIDSTIGQVQNFQVHSFCSFDA
jgi:cytochrome P450